MGAGRSRNIQ